MKIDTSTWKHFKIGDYFDIHPTKAYTGLSNKDLNDGGETPFVVNSATNNGIGGFSTKPATEKGNIITFSDTTEGNTFFYQPHDFIGFSHVQGMYEKNHAWTRNQLLFLVSVLKFTCVGRYTYGRKMTRENIAASLVLLPSDEYGLPDWQWMESYIDSLHSEPLKTNNADKAILDAFAFDIREWREFRVEELFDSIYKVASYNDSELERVDVWSEKAIPYVTRTDLDNSVKSLVLSAGLANIEAGNAIVIGDTTSTISYQLGPFVAGEHIIAARADWMNKYTGLFITCLLRQERYRYSYGRAYKLDSIRNTEIRLPVTSDGVPDWQWMESYIKSLPYGDRL